MGLVHVIEDNFTFDDIQFDVPDNSVIPAEMINVSAAVSGGEPNQWHLLKLEWSMVH